MNQSPYQTYVYSYPHKTAYRKLKPRSLSEIWATEHKNALFLYIHIPFCEMRCGFCNLFTTVSHNDDFVSRYVAALQQQANQVKSSLGNVQFARFALGGGTPTQLSIEHLESVLDVAESMKAKLLEIPGSVEVSPETATDEKLRLLRDRGLDRISIGVQSFIDSEVLATQRRQTSDQVKAALTRIREASFPTLNIDLIYGLPGQTVETWLQSLKTALVFEPEEVYLYPLYVRPLTCWIAQYSRTTKNRMYLSAQVPILSASNHRLNPDRSVLEVVESLVMVLNRSDRDNSQDSILLLIVLKSK
jgi:oxygen-independent coproporphyrinogen III oxidase